MGKMISIIVPVYNAESTLDRCISALIEQTYQNIEIILVNDGSVDHSLEICRHYAAKDGRIRVIDKPNGGVSSARNAGLECAQGEFIMFCDSDDWAEPDWCEKLLELYQPGMLPMCGYYCHFKDGHQDVICCTAAHTTIPKEEFFIAMSLGAYNPWNKIFKCSVIEKAGLRFSTQMTLGEDALFVWQYLQAISGGFRLTSLPLNHYTWPEGNSLTQKLPENYHEQCTYFFEQIHKDIQQGAPCSPDSFQSFVDLCYFQFERALKRIFQNDRHSLQKRIAIANNVMQGSTYRFVAFGAKSTQHPIVRCLCRFKHSLPLYLMYLIGKY